jgi:hypothetical protein
MTYGNTSWHELGQGYVDRARDQLEQNTQRHLESAWDQNKDLKEKIKQTEDINNILKLRVEKAEAAAQVAQKEADAFKTLLSRPMQEIAAVNGDFKQAYEVQQQMLAEWILAQRAYKETATALGLQVGKTAEEVQQLAGQNANAVLENRTEHGNDANTNPMLSTHADAILAMRKKNGKA